MSEITLIAITKTRPPSDVRLLSELGVTDVGENRDQEAAAKAAACARLGVTGLTWHFVGQLQTNKAASVARYAEVVHSVDRIRLVRALGRHARQAGRTITCLVQVSLDADPGRGRGAARRCGPALADAVAAEDGLVLGGVMAVAPLGEPAAAAFGRLADIAAGVRARPPGRDHDLGGHERRPGGRRSRPARHTCVSVRRCSASGAPSSGNVRRVSPVSGLSVPALARPGRPVDPRGGTTGTTEDARMASAMRKMAVYLGLVEDDHRYQEQYDSYEEYDEYTDHDDSLESDDGPEVDEPDSQVGQEMAHARPDRRPAALTQTTDLARITTLHPRTYNEARTIGEHFRDGTPVIMNLTEMVDSDAKRLVNFAAGLIFGLRGSIDRVTNRVFLLSPMNVEVTDEDKARIAERGFFNQS